VSNFDLPLIVPDASPEFTDIKSCSAWLHTVPLVNVGPSHNRILGQTEELNCFELAPAERLRIMELLIEPAAFVQVEHAKKFAGKPVPLTTQEREIFHNVVALWDALLHGYLRCLSAIVEGNSALNGQAALVSQRALWCAGQRMAEHYRSCQAIGDDDWIRLHRIYAIAEERGLLEQPVQDATQKTHQTSCRQTYVQSLLIHLASDPSEQTLRQMGVLLRWLQRWSQKVRIGKTLPASEHGIAPMAIDLASARGPVHDALSGDTVRFLDLEELSRSMRSRVAQLRKGETPQTLGLGDELSTAAAEQLLLIAHQHWCEEPKVRASSRRSVSIPAQLCTGLAAMHYYVGGKPFRQPGVAKELSKEQREEIATFGRMATRQDDDHSLVQGYVLENWTIQNESLGGLRIERTEDGGRGRFVQQQLIAVRPADAKVFMLGALRWLVVSENFDLRAGVRVFPGVPQCVAVRATGLNAMNDKYTQALLLPAVPALQTPPTLILPAGWYRPKRMIEVFSDGCEQILLTSIVDRGSDFERVAIGAP
jgi:cyclic-di-GMP-binding protein